MSRFLVIALLPMLIGIHGCDDARQVNPSGAVVKIGFIGPQQGPKAALGQDTLQGVLSAQAVKPLLDNGDRLEILAEDSGNDPQVTWRAMQKLVHEDGVTALLLGLDSHSLLQVAQFSESLQTPAIALIATHPGIVTGSDYISQLCFDDATQGSVAALFVRDELLIKRAAVIVDPGDPHSRFLQEAFEKKFLSTGGELTGSHSVADINEGLLRHLQARGTEVLYLPISAQHVLQLEELLGEIEWSPEVMVSDGLLANVLSLFQGRAADLDGMYSTDLFSDRGEFVRHRRLGRQAEVSFGYLFDDEENTFTGLGVEGYAILVHAMNRCASASDRQCVNREIRATKDFIGTMAKISIGADGRASRPVYINTIENGYLKSVVKVY